MDFPLEVRLKNQQDANNELWKKVREFEKLNDGIMDENEGLKEKIKKLKEEKKLGLEVCNKLNNKIKKLNNKIKKLNKKITPPLTERILPNGTIFIS